MAQLSGPIIPTVAGRAELLSGDFAPTQIAFGTASWTPTDEDDALTNEVARVPLSGTLETIGGDAVLHLTGLDDSSASYTVREIALFDASDVCLAIYSQATDIAVKASGTDLLLSLDWTLVNGGEATITLGDTTYQLPAASETESGIVERATQAEVLAGADATRYVSPATLASLTASDTRRGLVELATNAEVQAGSDTERAVTPAGLASLTASDTRRGLVELATTTEAAAGTDTARAVTPAGLEALKSILKARINNRTTTTIFAESETKTEHTFTGLVPNAAYLVQVVGRGSHNGTGGADLQLVGVTDSGSTLQATSSPFVLQGRLVANGSGQLAVQLRNNESTKEISTTWCSVSAQLAM